MADPNSEGKMSLRLVSSAMTRASDAQHKEDFLDKVDLYLFGSTTEASKWHTTIDTNANGSITLNGENEIYIPASALNSVGNSPKLYVIANYDNTTSPLPESATLAELQKQVVAKASWGPTAETEAWKAQSSFVMEGLGDVTKNGNQLSGTVNLRRAAAKIDLSITDIVDQVVSGDYVWKPVVGADHALNVTMKNAVTTSYVGADWDKTYEYFGTNGSTVNYTFKAGTTTTVDGVTTTPYSQTNPFYSYSSDQAKGANEAYMVLVVPWQKYDKQNNAVGDVENLYYEVPIGGRDNKRIERNYHYKVSIYVGTLGSTSKDESVTLEPEITVVDWSTGQIAVDIKEAKYLVVDETVVNIYNENVYDIAYASSHPVTAVITKVTKPNVSGRIEQTTTIYQNTNGATTITPSGSGNNNPFNVSVVDGKIVLSHVLNNDSNTNSFDYVPYDITVLVTNSVGMSEEITYRQYPEMYISVDLNSDYNNDNNNSNDNDNRGFAWVNNSRNTLGNLNGYSTSNSNSNPNMIIITTSALGSSSNFIIGDPRVADVNNLNYGNSWASVQDINGTTRRLSNYYPTNTSSEMSNVISPQFRIASSYGLTSNISFTNAQLRCASYQEDGYPAGRWRIPTSAELKYIVELSAKGYITRLFNDDGDYWAADGKYYTPHYNTGVVDENTAGSNKTAYVRCVYDDWYWGSEPIADKTKFTWGDMPR
ncbi:MAG: hypothetical protein IIW91_00830 [Alistipes sp.]|nr:hypothetical protein [Alistipes sp.]